MASWPRLIVVFSVLLVGCSADSTSVTSAEPTLPGSPTLPMHTTEATTAETQPGTTHQEPPPTAATWSTTTTTTVLTTTTQVTSEATAAAVNAVLVEYLPASLADTNFGGKAFCGHYLHGIEQNGDDVSAYISGWCHEYYVAQGLMEMGTGHGIHARVDLKAGAAGLSAYDFEQAGDGEGEPEIFPQWVLEAMRIQRTVIVPDQPLTQAADYFEAQPQRSLSAGATCAQVSEQYRLYEFGVMYWLREGRPVALDGDNDGRPCEDEFARHLVDWYWEPLRFPLKSGLFCRDLDELGLDLGDAVAYWLREQRPSRMDADGDGIPCETVFDEQDFSDLYAPVAGEAPGQFCRDLDASGYRFPDVLAYWLMEGTPDRMDADGNGRPCETVYDPMEIATYLWSADTELDSGLLCRDLVEEGLGFHAAVSYWLHQGMPVRMDADLDGIPCETVYDQFEIDDWVEFDRIWRVEE